MSTTILRTKRASAQPGSRKKRSISNPSAFWQNGQVLKVSFYNGTDDALKNAILSVAKQWSEFANLDFELVEDEDDSANLRIETGVHEKVVIGALGRTQEGVPGPNMHLGLKPDHADFTHSVLGLFGMALGLCSEHQHPRANIPWDLDGLRAHLWKELEAEEEEDHEQALELIDKMIEEAYMPLHEEWLFTLRYDPLSIMHSKIEAAWTLDGRTVAQNTVLSAKDKQAVAMIYPGRYDLNA